ncbi:LysR family transcriptional regulator [Streptomyces genisteinicus]|uniref:LysR family transcriptional regulator n=1 Tax=Streptomyces genisteinicus TaxID=2768068 RepID=A0A7H0HUL2_9ACTN|nr:LysR family transcriptional regulator [Streptomyces genisteinicus]QNP64228.1 LysR family transcriptional regulator [Streptomyces genisteinicus]
MAVGVHHLRTFLMAVEEGSISKAAARLHMAQSAVSRRLAELERQVKQPLLERSAEGVQPTVAGKTFCAKADAAVTAFDDALRSDLQKVRALRVGHAWSAAGMYTSEILRRWQETNPEVQVRLRRVDDPAGGLTSGLSDVAIMRTHARRRNLHEELLVMEPRVVAVAVNNPLTALSGIRLSDLVSHPLVVNSFSGTTTLGLWQDGRQPVVAVDVDTIDDWQTYIAASVGIGVTPASTAWMHPHSEIAYLPILDAPPVPVYLVWASNNQHPALRSFIRLARDVVAEAGD